MHDADTINISQADPGYYSATAPLAYNFVKENIFYSSLLLFAFVYNHDRMYPYVRALPVLEAAFVFLPYTWRRLFPKTSFRPALAATAAKKAGGIQAFYTVLTWLTKVRGPTIEPRPHIHAHRTSLAIARLHAFHMQPA